ncbi:hypothetical protein PRIPAC_76379 [Pristionchus pacificus]|nr:hypothetical protein PRIPAC_76379 [Pristionchus pacificus]
MGTPICKPPKPTGVEYQQESHDGENATSMTEVSLNGVNATINNNNILFRDVKTQGSISNHIDRSLQKQKKEELSRLKILLLGGADAGKSTIVKQMRILHMNGFSAEEMHSFQKYLRYNLFQIFHMIAMGVQECILSIPDFEKDIIEQFAQGLSWIIDIDVSNEIDALNSFLKLDCVAHFMEIYPNYSSLPDNAHYYMPKVSEMLSPSYMPTADDVLHLRIPTTHVNEINFTFSTCTIRLIDVGGQRTYRKKWIHCFDGVAAVLFVASMAAYDQSLDEVDSTIKPILYKDVFAMEPDKPQKVQNRLRDSAHLFGEMLRSKFLTSSAFILFLNKKDLFHKKLPNSPLGNYLHGFKGSDFNSACEFLKTYFLKRKSKKDKDRKIYSHYTCATDTQNVEFVFKATCDIVLQKNLNSSGIQL